MSVGDMVGCPRALGVREVVVVGLWHHVFGRDEIHVVVLYMLQPVEVADRADRRAADLAGSFRDVVRHRENLRGLLVKEEVVVPEILACTVPMAILGRDVRSEEHTSELQYLMRTSYAVFCLKQQIINSIAAIIS